MGVPVARHRCRGHACLFVTATSGAKQDRLHVLCFKLGDGSLRWERQFWATGRTMTHEKISGATPSPASDRERIYALFSSDDCVALDFDGNLVWYRGLGRDYPNASNSLRSPHSVSPAVRTVWRRRRPGVSWRADYLRFSGLSPCRSRGRNWPSRRMHSSSNQTSPPPHSGRWTSTMSQWTADRFPLSQSS